MASTSLTSLPKADQLSPAQEALVQKQAQSIMDIVKSAPKGEKFIPHVIDNILTEEQWDFLTHHGKKCCLEICIRAKIICKKPQQAEQKSLGSLYWGEAQGTDGFTPQYQNGINANGGSPSVPRWSVLVDSHFQGPGDPRLSQLIYCFQHYANAAENRIANPEFVQNPPTNRFSTNVLSRTGVLDVPTMQKLEYLVSSQGFKKVSATSADLHLLGQIFGAKLVCSLSWDRLDAKFNAFRPTLVNSLANDTRFSSILSTNALDPNVLEILSVNPSSLPTNVSSVASQIQSQIRSAQQLAQRSGAMLDQASNASRSALPTPSIPPSTTPRVAPQVAQPPQPRNPIPSFTPGAANRNIEYTPVNVASMDPRRRGF